VKVNLLQEGEVELYDLAPATDAPAFFELSAVRR